jgi:hypothetical protein
LNCDSHENEDTLTSNGDGQSADGFGCHPKMKGDTGERLSWVRACNGFKGGGYGDPQTDVPTPTPQHIIRFNAAFFNKANGLYARSVAFAPAQSCPAIQRSGRVASFASS